MNPIKVLIVDDHQLIRAGIKLLCAGSKKIRVIGEASDGSEALEILASKNCDIVLMDINMPILGGIDATLAITSKYPNTKVIAISMHDEYRYISKMLQAGARGYLSKGTDTSELVTAISKVNNGETYFSQKISATMMSKFMTVNSHGGATRSKTNSPLSNREIVVLKLIATEHTNHDIALKLGLSARTVDTHRRNIMSKLDVHNTAGLVKYVIERGLLDD